MRKANKLKKSLESITKEELREKIKERIEEINLIIIVLD